MSKYSKQLENLPFDLLHIAQSFANDNKSPKIEPAHLLRALLHKSAGLVNYIEDTLDEDYYYMVDWADMRMQQCDKSPYAMKGIELSRDTEMVVQEAMEIAEQAGMEQVDGRCLLAALLSWPPPAHLPPPWHPWPLLYYKCIYVIHPAKN